MQVIGYNNAIDAATVGGTGWKDSYPLSKVKNRYLRDEARSDDTASKKVTLDLGSATAIGCVGLINTNLTESASIRVKAAATTFVGGEPGTLLYDSGSKSPNGYGDFMLLLASAITARYWSITISDGSSSHTYMSLGRIFMGPVWSSAGESWGSSLATETESKIQTALDGAEFFEARRQRRVWRGSFDWMNNPKATELFSLQRQVGIGREVLLIDSANPLDRWRNFLGRMRTLSPIEWPYVNQYKTGLEISEWL